MKRDAVVVTPASHAHELRAELTHALGFGDLTETMKEAAGLIDMDFARNFARAEGPNSGPWPPRKQGSTGLERGEGHPLEIKTGAQFEALSGPFGEGHVEDVGPRGADIGVDPSSIPGKYVFAQNYGYRYADGRVLPQREMADITDETADKIAELIADAIEAKLAGA